MEQTMLRGQRWPALALLVAALMLLEASGPAHAGRKNPGGKKGTAPKPSGGSATRGFAFLEDQLPLKVVLTTPTEIVKADKASKVRMSGMQALTVVFSRPAIALGSDFGEGSAKGKFPFSLDCKVPGKMRWVTTAMVRFDPDVDWPPDLDCAWVWNTGFTGYDGARLQLADAPIRRTLYSDPLDMSLSDVSSKKADELTDDNWDARTGSRDDKMPEVPPDGILTLSFGNQVNLKLVQDALQIFKGAADKPAGQPVGVIVGPCYSPVLPGAKLNLDVNETCASVNLTQPLAPDTYYTLRLPKGSRYHALSGPLAKDLDVQVAGLRPFRIPLMGFRMPDGPKDTYFDTLEYRRLRIWLPHGLAEGVTPAQLLPLISVCQYADGFSNTTACNPLSGLKIEPLEKAILLLTVPDLRPQLKYRVSIAASSTVKDGFGQPLLAYFTEFWTSEIDPVFRAPSTPSDVILMEAFGDAEDQRWRYAVRPPATQPPGGTLPRGATTLRSAAAWSIPYDTDADLLKFFTVVMNNNYDRYVPGVLGAPHLEVALPAGGNAAGDDRWQQLGLDLPGPSSVHVVHICCDKVYYPKPEHDASSDVQFIFRSNLSVSVVQSGDTLTAWVTSAAQGGGAVEGATVRLLAEPFSSKDITIASRCTTDATGVCSMSTADLRDIAGYNVFVNKVSQAAMVRDSNFYTGGPRRLDPWVATLVLDRLVVVPGDSLKVTAFVQSVASNGALQLPTAMKVPLFVDPAFNDKGKAEPILATLNGETGTLHAEVPVPADAKMARYSLSLRLPGPRDKEGKYADWSMGADQPFTVADPRPPTAELKVDVPPWTKPTGQIKIDVTAVSYIGASVDNAAMTLTWVASSDAKGQEQLLTGTDGSASFTLDLGKLEEKARPTAGSSVSVEVEWIGPTRERIVQTASVSVADAARTLSLSRSLDTNLPGVAFGVAATLRSSADGSEVKDVPVTITLKPNATNGPDPASAACAGKQLSAACNPPSGAGYAGCQLALPCPGVYVMKGCAAAGEAAADGEACSEILVGVTEKVWVDTPWSKHDVPQLWTDRPSYAIGDTAVLSFQNPWPNARALVQWGNVNKLRTQTVLGGLASGGVATISIKLGDECKGGCGLTLVVDVPRQPGAPYAPGEGPLPGVRVSRVFDPVGPHTHVMETELVIEEPNDLAVAVAVEGGWGTTHDVDGAVVRVVEPGAAAKVTVDVKVPGAGGAAGVEVTLYAVDESFLALAPYPLPKPEADMVLDLAASFTTYGSDALRLAPKSVREVFTKLMARLTGIDPWLPADTTCYPQQNYYYWNWGGPSGSSSAAVDTADDAYIKRYDSRLTYEPGYGFSGGCYRTYDGFLNCPPTFRGGYYAAFGGGLASGAGASESDTGDGRRSKTAQPLLKAPPSPQASPAPTDSSSSSSAVSVRVQEDFLVTPLFVNAKADASGRATFTFTAPQNLGSFALRAFAVSGSVAKYGSGEGKVVVKRKLSLTPSLPRFVRASDVFEAGVVVTVGAAPGSVIVNAKLESGSPLELSGPSQLTATFAAGGGVQQEVRFKFSAKAIGTAKTTITAVLAGDGASDGLELELDVLGQQGDVWVATSFAIAANGSTATWQEGVELPAAVPGSGALALTAGIGYFPTIDGFYSSLLEQEKYRDTSIPYAPLALLWATQPALFSYYARGLTAPNNSVAVTRALGDLDKLTDDDLGLMYSLRQPDDFWWPDRPNLWLNIWGCYLVKRHQTAFKAPGTLLGSYQKPWQALSGARAATWAGAADRELVQQAVDARNAPVPGPYSDFNMLAWMYYTFGMEWVPKTNTRPQIKEDISFARLLQVAADSKQVSLETQTLVALTLIAGGEPGHSLVALAVDEVQSRLRVQGRTAYVAYSRGSQSPAAIDDQAMDLLLLLKSSQTDLLVPKLATYVSNPFKRSGLYECVIWPSYVSTALVSAALADYDTARGSAKPNLKLLANAGDITVLQASFTPANTAPVSNSTAWGDLHSPPGPLQFKATGTGEVSIAASLHFVPAKLLPYPSYRGIYVESAIQLLEPFTGDATGKPLKTVPLASVVAYTVQITSPDRLGAVTISVMMPGGLEPLDPNVAGVSGGANGPQSYCPIYWMAGLWRSWYWYWYWPICPTQETRPSIVTFHYDSLMAGTSTVTIKAVAASVGSFVLPPVRAYADDQPEVMGMTAGGALTVCQGCQPEYAEAGPQLKGCPANCNGNGVCNPVSGKCTCDSDFTGQDCKAFSAAA